MRMSNHIHHNPVFSFCCGLIGGTYSLIQSQSIDFNGFYESIRAIIVAFICGAIGYFGKIVAERWHKWLKEQAKNKCK